MPDPVQPARFLVSPGLTPETVTRTRTSPEPGAGSGTSPTCSTSAAGPCASYQEASMVAPFVVCQLADALSGEGSCGLALGAWLWVVLAEGLADPGAFSLAGGAGGEQHAAPVGVTDVLGTQRLV